MRKLLYIIAAVMLVATTACDKDEDVVNDSSIRYMYDLVTYVGDEDGHARFELVGRDVSGSTMLITQASVPEGTALQQRFLLRYNYADEAEGAAQRKVSVYGLTKVITDSLRVGKADLNYYAMQPVKMRSAWRTGDFINVHCQVEYTGKNRAFMMLIDDATRNNDTVQCYLHHDMHGDTTYQWRECYASFNVGNVWKRTDCHTLRLHVNDYNGGEKCYDFDRK